MSRSESRRSGRQSTPEAVDSMMILQNCFVTVSRLNLGCFSEPDKTNIFKGWYISNVRIQKLQKNYPLCYVFHYVQYGKDSQVHIMVFHQYPTYTWVSFIHGIFTAALSIAKLHTDQPLCIILNKISMIRLKSISTEKVTSTPG